MSAIKKHAPPSGYYKVQTHTDNWKNHTHARLLISMLSHRHTGRKFYATCEWAAQRFEKTTLVIGDTLQRHNIKLEHRANEVMAFEVAKKIGDSWLDENSEAIALLTNPIITRWTDWISHPDFYDMHARVYDQAKNPSFARLIDSFSERIHERRQHLPREALFHYSHAYILEELAAFQIMCKDPAIDVYPGTGVEPLEQWLHHHAGFRLPDRLVIDFVKNKASEKIAA